MNRCFEPQEAEEAQNKNECMSLTMAISAVKALQSLSITSDSERGGGGLGGRRTALWSTKRSTRPGTTSGNTGRT